LDQALHPDPMPHHRTRVAGRDLDGKGQPSDDGYFFHTNGEAQAEVQLPGSGRYRLEVRAGGSRGGDDFPNMHLLVNGERVESWTVDSPMAAPGSYVKEMELTEGSTRLGVAFDNDFYDEHFPDPQARDRNL